MTHKWKKKNFPDIIKSNLTEKEWDYIAKKTDEYYWGAIKTGIFIGIFISVIIMRLI